MDQGLPARRAGGLRDDTSHTGTAEKSPSAMLRQERGPVALTFGLPLILSMGLFGMPKGQPILSDQSAFAYVGWMIMQGHMPYVDAWDNKGPFTYLAFGLVSLVSHAYGIWLLQVILLFGSAWLLYRLSRLLVTPWLAGLATIMAMTCFGVDPTGMNGSGTELLALPALTYLMILATRALAHRVSPSPVSALLAGALTVFAIGTRANNLIAILPVLIMAFASLFYLAGWRRGLSYTVLVALGAALMALPVVMWLHRGQAWQACLDAAYTGSLTWTHTLGQAIANTIRLTVAAGPLPVIIALAFAGMCLRRSPRLTPALSWTILSGFALFLVANLGPGNAYTHYLLACLPLLAIAAAYVTEGVQAWVCREFHVRSSVGVIVIATLIGLIMSPQLPSYVGYVAANVDHGNKGSPPVLVAAIRYVDSHTTVSDLVYSDLGGALNYNSQRLSPSRYFYFPVGSWLPELRTRAFTEIVSDIETKRPVLLVFSTAGSVGIIESNLGSTEAVNQFDAFLSTNYTQQDVNIGATVVYRLNAE